jgi:hypothetical protein
VFDTGQCCRGLDGETPSAHLAMKDKPFRNQTGFWTAGSSQKSPLRRCFKSRPQRRTEFAGFASGCRSEFLGRLSLESLVSPGGWRASCPATYRPTRDHRHVRNWANAEIIHSRWVSSITCMLTRENCGDYEHVNAARSRVAAMTWRACVAPAAFVVPRCSASVPQVSKHRTALRARAHFGRRTARTLPLLPPPQKKRSLPFASSPETTTLAGISSRSRTAPVAGSMRRSSL